MKLRPFSLPCFLILFTMCQGYQVHPPIESTTQSQTHTTSKSDEGSLVPQTQISELNAVHNQDGVLLTWENPSSDPGFYQVQINRSQNQAPSTPEEGEVIYIGSTEQFQDYAASDEETWFYTVFACNKQGDCETQGANTSIETTLYSVGGSVLGLDDTLILSNQGASLTMDETGFFTFHQKWANNTPYHIRIIEQPEHLSCEITNPLGLIQDEDISNIEIKCVPTYTLGGTVYNLDGSLIVSNQHRDFCSISENGAYTFPTRYTGQQTYDISIASSDSEQSCVVSNSTGTLLSNSINSIHIHCYKIGNGSDGVLHVTEDTIVNSISTTVSTDIPANSTSFDVDDPTGFATEDRILIIQHQGTGVGSWEERSITVSGSTFSFSTPLVHSYSQSGGTDVFAIYRIPQYEEVTIYSSGRILAQPWDGSSGGIIAFKVKGDITMYGGSIDASETGYRGGGCGSCGDADWGLSGEGIINAPDQIPSTNDPGLITLAAIGDTGGAGAYNLSGFDGSPGGGGGYGTAGAPGTSNDWDAEGGYAIGDAELSQLFFGGGGGGPGDQDNHGPTTSRIGGSGGGIIYIESLTMNQIKVYANGGTPDPPSSYTGGASGSGAGGSIYLRAATILVDSIEANGGESVTTGDDDTGGAGGEGRIRIDSNELSGSSISPTAYEGSF